MAVGSLAFIGILTETVMTVLFPQLMREFNVNTATVQWITTIYLLTVAATMPLSSYLNRKFKHRVLFLAAVALAVLGSLTMIFGHAFPGDSSSPHHPGHRLRRGHTADDEHHSRTVSTQQGRTTDGRRFARHYRAPAIARPWVARCRAFCHGVRFSSSSFP